MIDPIIYFLTYKQKMFILQNFLESGIWKFPKSHNRYKKLQNLQVLGGKSKSVTKIEWKKCSTFQKWSKFVNFQTISRNPKNFWKIGILKF